MIPNLTTEQRRENLEKAKAARQRRAAILKSVADGSYSVVDVLNMALEDETVSRMLQGEQMNDKESCIKGVMTLSLHIVQQMRRMGGYEV